MAGSSRVFLAQIAALGALIGVGTGLAAAEKRWVDIERSTVTIHLPPAETDQPEAAAVVIEAPLAEGSLDDHESPHLTLVLNVDEFVVTETGRRGVDRERVRAEILGTSALDATRFSRITYHSLAVAQGEAGVWLVRGELEMHGRFLPLDVTAVRDGDRFTGTATVSPAEFGVLPLHLAGTASPVGHEVRVDFEIVLEAR